MLIKRKREKTLLENVIETTLIELESTKDFEKRSELVDVLLKLYKMQETDLSHRVDPNTLITAAGSILGILAILAHERVHVVTSKALSFVLKLR